MERERDRLEVEAKQRLAALHAAARRNPTEDVKTSNAVCRLALESDALRNEKLEIHQKLQQLKRLWS